MGYFSNGSEADDYEGKWCSRCIHKDGPDARGNQACAVWGAHIFHNYQECNNAESILHELIPQEGISNGKCAMFADVKGHQ